MDDIPSSTGVVSVNGKDGVVILDSEDIPLDSGAVETVGDAIWQNRDNFAELYDEEETYSVGDYAIGQDGTLYKCNTAISTPEVFTPAHWTAVRVTDEIRQNSDDVNGLMKGLAIIVDGDTVPALIAVPDGGYAYIRNNTHGLADGLYVNSSGSDFPYSGGTADNTVFTSVEGSTGGALNALNSNIAKIALLSIANLNISVPDQGYAIEKLNSNNHQQFDTFINAGYFAIGAYNDDGTLAVSVNVQRFSGNWFLVAHNYINNGTAYLLNNATVVMAKPSTTAP